MKSCIRIYSIYIYKYIILYVSLYMYTYVIYMYMFINIYITLIYLPSNDFYTTVHTKAVYNIDLEIITTNMSLS